MGATRRRLITVASTALLTLSWGAGGALADDPAPVELLRFPFPYQAAVTVCSDADQATVEVFEGVHTLVNTTSWIPRDPQTWDLLFADPEIDARPEWQQGIAGFGLPIADSIFLYQHGIGLYSRFDEQGDRPVPYRSADGRDHRDIVDDWIRRGWLDSLHTGGSGEITRRAMQRGLEWFESEPRRRLSVWVNHSIEATPSSIEPDHPDGLRRVSKNLAKLALLPLARLLEQRLPLEDSLAILPLPRGQRLLLWTLSITLLGSLAWTGACSSFPGSGPARAGRVASWRSPGRS
jgi:hypothetical protein